MRSGQWSAGVAAVGVVAFDAVIEGDRVLVAQELARKTRSR
jgi:hypothetical protein